jgi:hypothetical protein
MRAASKANATHKLDVGADADSRVGAGLSGTCLEIDVGSVGGKARTVQKWISEPTHTPSEPHLVV